MALDEMVNGATTATKEYAGKYAGPLGILGTVLGGASLLGVGAQAGGILGNGGNPQDSPYVGKDMFYQTTQAQSDRIWGVVNENQKTNSATEMHLMQEICDLKAAVAVNNTANEYQNQIIDRDLRYVDMMNQKNVELLECKINGAGFVRATPMINPSQIGMGLVGETRVLDTRSAYPENRNRDDHCGGFRSSCAF